MNSPLDGGKSLAEILYEGGVLPCAESNLWEFVIGDSGGMVMFFRGTEVLLVFLVPDFDAEYLRLSAMGYDCKTVGHETNDGRFLWIRQRLEATPRNRGVLDRMVKDSASGRSRPDVSGRMGS